MTGLPPDLKNISLDNWDHPVFRENDIRVSVLRLDKIHPVISGNKWFKLKYYLKKAREANKKTLASFGGAYSNHLLALSAAAQLNGFSSLGIVRGEEPENLSHTLQAAKKYGMELRFLSRDDYNLKKKYSFEIGEELVADAVNPGNASSQVKINAEHDYYGNMKIETHDPDVFLIPEGGAGKEGMLGAEEILSLVQLQDYTHVCCAAGTGTTLAGLINSAGSRLKIVGVSVLKGTRHFEPLNLSWINNKADLENVLMVHTDHFGGYAKYTASLLDFMNQVFAESGIPTDFVYTGKLFYAVARIAAIKSFPAKSRILVLHTGGLQGNASLAYGRLQF